MLGGKDPDNRRTFPWDKLEEGEKKPIFSFVKELIELRKKSQVLRDGSLEIECKPDGLDVVRELKSERKTLRVFRDRLDSENSFIIE